MRYLPRHLIQIYKNLQNHRKWPKITSSPSNVFLYTRFTVFPFNSLITSQSLSKAPICRQPSDGASALGICSTFPQHRLIPWSFSYILISHEVMNQFIITIILSLHSISRMPTHRPPPRSAVSSRLTQPALTLEPAVRYTTKPMPSCVTLKNTNRIISK